MIAPEPFFEPRGTPISISQRLQGLSALGHTVDLVTYPLGQPVAIRGVRICRTLPVPFIQRVAIGPSWPKLVLDALLFAAVWWRLLWHRYDVIHSHEEGAFMALLLAPLFRTPHLYDMHSSLPRQLANYQFGNRRPVVRLFAWLEDRVLQTAQVVLTVGRDLEEHVTTRRPALNHLRLENVALPPERPVDPQAVNQLRARLGVGQQFVVVYTGNLERYQGLDLLREAVRPLVARHPDVVIVVVGGESEQIAAEREHVRRLGLDAHFVFPGKVPPAEIPGYLALADVLVSPRTEGLSIPLKLYAYLQSGKPIVATRIVAHTQLLTEDQALLVEATAGGLAAGLQRLRTEPQLRQALGRQAQALAAEICSPSRFRARLNQAYLSIQLRRPISELPSELPETAPGWA